MLDKIKIYNRNSSKEEFNLLLTINNTYQQYEIITSDYKHICFVSYNDPIKAFIFRDDYKVIKDILFSKDYIVMLDYKKYIFHLYNNGRGGAKIDNGKFFNLDFELRLNFGYSLHDNNTIRFHHADWRWKTLIVNSKECQYKEYSEDRIFSHMVELGLINKNMMQSYYDSWDDKSKTTLSIYFGYSELGEQKFLQLMKQYFNNLYLC